MIFSGHAVLLCERHGDDDSFSWKLGVDRGLKDLEDSSVIRIPRIYRFIMKFVTPTLLLAIFWPGWPRISG